MASQVAERTKARDLGKFENFDQPKKQMKQTNLLNSNPTNPTTTKQPENPHHLVFQPTATIYQQNQATLNKLQHLPHRPNHNYNAD